MRTTTLLAASVASIGLAVPSAQAQSASFGAACAGASGVTPTIGLAGPSSPFGGSWQLEVTAPGGLGLGYLLVGFSSASSSLLGGLPLPTDLGSFFADPLWSGCSLNVDPSFALQPYFFDPNTNGGSTAFTFPALPLDSAVYVQAINVDPDFVTRIAGVSRGLRVGEAQLVPGMVLIGPQTFAMGSSAGAGAPYFNGPECQPVRVVDMEALWIGRHEVTQAEYVALMASNPSATWGPNRPVEQVSWFDAMAYCEALTAREAARGNLPFGFVYRLPTEAEWEYCCRAQTTSEFNVGSALQCTHANFKYSVHSGSSCGATGTRDVGTSGPSNYWGLFDMHGNVWEWCLDSYDTYDSSVFEEPFVTGGPYRIRRGGGWRSHSNNCRSATRSASVPTAVDSDRGFRVVLAAEVGPIGNLGAGPATTFAGFVPIAPGTFDMGSNAPAGSPYFGYPSQQPVHPVTISQPFWIGEHEVTQGEYESVMGENPSTLVQSPVRPVDSVSWHDARAYCAALTSIESQLGTIPAGYEFRLPTEAEWEFGCRAGTTSEYAVGDGATLLCSDARFYASWHTGSTCGNPSQPADVGSYPANAWGIHDMAGNVQEWCLDSYAPYPPGPVTDPFVTGGSERIVRGGHWAGWSDACRSGYRAEQSAGSVYVGTGFRVVLAPIREP